MDGRRATLTKLSLGLVLLGGRALTLRAQPHAASAPAAQVAPVAPQMLNDKDVWSTQMELIRLLRLSPTLTTVVEHDPSLLANQEYGAKNNPQLAAFLTQDPEVARNPDYFLYSHLQRDAGQPDEAMERPALPSASALWWRAQLRRRDEALEKMARPILGAEIFATVMLVVVALCGRGWEWRRGIDWRVWFSSIHLDALRPTSLAVVSGLVVYFVSEKQ